MSANRELVRKRLGGAKQWAKEAEMYHDKWYEAAIEARRHKEMVIGLVDAAGGEMTVDSGRIMELIEADARIRLKASEDGNKITLSIRIPERKQEDDTGPRGDTEVAAGSSEATSSSGGRKRPKDQDGRRSTTRYPPDRDWET